MGMKDSVQDVLKLLSGSPVTKMVLPNKSILLSYLDYRIGRGQNPLHNNLELAEDL